MATLTLSCFVPINLSVVHLSLSGRLSNDNSGFSGRWVRQTTVLDNQFYELLVDDDSPTGSYTQSTQGNGNGEFSVSTKTELNRWQTQAFITVDLWSLI
jgi:hypothetical protein